MGKEINHSFKNKLQNSEHTTVHGLLYTIAGCTTVSSHPALVTGCAERYSRRVITDTMSSTVVETFGGPTTISNPVGIARTFTYRRELMG